MLPPQQRPARLLLVPGLVAAQAALRPDAPALVTNERVVTYQELQTQATRLAHQLLALELGPESLVGLCLDRSIAYVTAALGILTAGAAYVPLDPAYPLDRLSFMLNDAQVPVLITDWQNAARLGDGSWHVIVADTVEPADVVSQPTLPVVESAVDPEHLSYVIYTSGSTGQPKGVQITHASLLNLVRWHQRAFDVTANDRTAQVVSPAFDGAVWEIWPNLAAGASVYLPDDTTRRTPELLRDWVVARGITILFLPTALAERVMALPWPAETALRVLLTGADTLQQYPSPFLPFAVVNNYGPTEATVVTTSGLVPPMPPAAHPERPPAIGRPIDNVEVYILDEELHPVPPGVPGELHVGGAGLARGYLNRPDLTAQCFIAHPFSAVPGVRLYKTGDLAYALPDGQIAFAGRLDEQVKIRGYRIEPGEIAVALNRHPAVETSLVVAHEETAGEKQLVAYVTARVGTETTTRALQAFLATRLPDYMVPTAFVWVAELPLTPNGKVDRSALPAPGAATLSTPCQEDEEDALIAPRTPVEERLTTIVTGLLHLDQISIDDNFFFLGGHSLMATLLIARVRDAFGVDLTLRNVFEAPTVLELANEVERLIIAQLEAMSDADVQDALGELL